MNNTNKPTYESLEEILKEAIRRRLKEMPGVDDETLKVFTPEIPDSRKEVLAAIDELLDPARKFNRPFDHSDLRDELLSDIEELGFQVNPELPTDDIRKEVRKQLTRMNNQELLNRGVFGKPFTQEQINYWKEFKVDGIYLQVVQAGLNNTKILIQEYRPSFMNDEIIEVRDEIVRNFANEILAYSDSILYKDFYGYTSRMVMQALRAKNLISSN